MSSPQSFVRAKFDGCGLFIIFQSPEIASSSEHEPLLPRLHILALQGWRAVRARFEGSEIEIEVERLTEIPYPTEQSCMVHMLCQFPFPEGFLISSTQHQQYVENFQEMGADQGWQVLATSKAISKNGLWVISLWVKNYPVSNSAPKTFRSQS